MKLIAETAWHHQGDYDFMQALVGALIENSGADVVKMHVTLDFDEYMHPSHPGYATLNNMLFTARQWSGLADRVKSAGRELMWLVNDTEAVKLAAEQGVDLLEVHAVCLNDTRLLAAIRSEISPDTKIVLGVGGSTLYEIDAALNDLQWDEVVLMFGFQNYPTRYQDINFRKMRRIMGLYPEYQYGFADHTEWNADENQLISLLGAAQGMDYLEKHVTIHPGEERIDWQSAIPVADCLALKQKLEILDACLGNGALALSPAEQSYAQFGPMKKAAVLKRDIRKDETIQEQDIVLQRTGETSDISQVDIASVIGQKAGRDLAGGSVLRRSDIDWS
jgi:N,N'-diacetyllegionaminate synthase